jgi:cytoskeletal protein RodZ
LKQLKRKQIGLLAMVVLLIAVVGTAVWATRHSGWRKVTASPSPSIVPGNSTHDEPSPSPTDGTTSKTPTPVPTSSPGGSTTGSVAKPSLQKSSGNAPGSSVPAGAVVEFSCEGTAGLSCELILTDRTNAAHVVNLGKKPITSNGRGQNFAIWDWNALAGSWSVVAKASDAAGNAATSDVQTLEVK